MCSVQDSKGGVDLPTESEEIFATKIQDLCWGVLVQKSKGSIYVLSSVDSIQCYYNKNKSRV